MGCPAAWPPGLLLHAASFFELVEAEDLVCGRGSRLKIATGLGHGSTSPVSVKQRNVNEPLGRVPAEKGEACGHGDSARKLRVPLVLGTFRVRTGPDVCKRKPRRQKKPLPFGQGARRATVSGMRRTGSRAGHGGIRSPSPAPQDVRCWCRTSGYKTHGARRDPRAFQVS